MDVTQTPPPAYELEDQTAESVARRLSALGEPTRLKLVNELRSRESASVHELAHSVGASMPNVSKHLQVLHNAGLVRRRKSGTSVQYKLTGSAVASLTYYALRIFGGPSRRP